MNNLEQSYKIILEQLRKIHPKENFMLQNRKPKLSDLEIVALCLTSEYMSIDSELQLFRVLKDTELDNKIERSVFNKRRRFLKHFTEEIQQKIVSKMNFSNIYIVDSKPIEVCKISRVGRSSVCATAEVKPAFGFVSSTKRYYFGYKLHAVCNGYGVIHSFDFTPANIHDVKYLQDIKSNLNDCILVGDKGYISAEYQQDLFTCSQIKLTVPMRKNQINYESKKLKYSKVRKRIETLFSQLDDQFMMKRNYAKTLLGLFIRVLAKITAVTMIQYLNIHVYNRKINKLKVNLY